MIAPIETTVAQLASDFARSLPTTCDYERQLIEVGFLRGYTLGLRAGSEETHKVLGAIEKELSEPCQKS